MCVYVYIILYMFIDTFKELLQLVLFLLSLKIDSRNYQSSLFKEKLFFKSNCEN